MVTLTEIECDDRACMVENGKKCGSYEGGDNVDYRDFFMCEIVVDSSEMINDDQMIFQNNERIVECSELETDWVDTGSEILKFIQGVSNGEIGEVGMKPYDVENINRSENMGLLLKDTESFQRVMEIVEVIEEQDKKSEIVVMENNGILSPEVSEDDKNSEIDSVEETQAENIHISPVIESMKSEHQNEEVFLENDIDSHYSNNVTDYETKIEICEDGEQPQLEVKEFDTVIFPASLVRVDFNIQFGTFGHTVDTISEPKVSNNETEPEYDVNINDHEQTIIDLLKDDNNVGCAGVDEINDDGQRDGQMAKFPIDVQIEEDELPPCSFLEETQMYGDKKLNEQIQNSQLQLDEKIKCRDAIMAELHIKWNTMIDHNEKLNAKNVKLRAARQFVSSIRQQIDHVQRLNNKIKNVIAVEDIDSRINKVEQMIKKGTLCSEDEKLLIHEIKQLKTMRVQLASNISSKDEIQRMLNQKDQIVELLESLNVELNTWKNKVSKAQMACNKLRQKYVEELEMEKELKIQLINVEKSHREANVHLRSLVEQLSNKNKILDELMVAWKFSSPRDEPLSVFSDEPLRDEHLRVFPDDMVTNSETVEEKHTDDQIKENVLEEVEQMVKNKEATEIIDIEEKENADELMKEYFEAKLKEKIQLVEKVKANERKKQNALTRAEIQAQKRENLRLKRLRKRERKRAAKGTSVDDGVSKEIRKTDGKPPRFLSRKLTPKFTTPPPAVVAAIRNRKPWRPHWRNMVISTMMVLILSVFFIV